jgi:hypothetical protein
VVVTAAVQQLHILVATAVLVVAVIALNRVRLLMLEVVEQHLKATLVVAQFMQVV